MASKALNLSDQMLEWSRSVVLQHHEVPSHFKEVYILSGYRPVSGSVSKCVASIFQVNNETLNVWTHLIGCAVFLLAGQGIGQELGYANEVAWPLYLFVIGSAAYALTSALAHTLNVLSWEARDICFFLDYAAIAFYGHCATCAYAAYALPGQLLSNSRPRLLVLASVCVALWSVFTSCRTRFMQRSLKRQLLRLSGFVLAYLLANLPIIMRLVEAADAASAAASASALPHWRRQLCLVLLTAFIYLTHLPERLWPGAFDFLGHSHQLFHLTSCMGTLDQLWALRADLLERQHLVAGLLPSGQLLCSAVLVAVINAMIVLHYSVRVFRQGPTSASVGKSLDHRH